jgi:hypothetical protein
MGWQGCHQKVQPLAGCYLTELVEPCAAVPRKCLFIHLFICVCGENALDNGHARLKVVSASSEFLKSTSTGEII